MNNVSAVISEILTEWAEDHHIKLKFIKPGTLTQNSYTEHFNQTHQNEILNICLYNIL